MSYLLQDGLLEIHEDFKGAGILSTFPKLQLYVLTDAGRDLLIGGWQPRKSTEVVTIRAA